MFTIAFTGHRPPKLGGYGESAARTKLLEKLDDRLTTLQIAHGDEIICISGMALGFDQWAAQKCIDLDIPFIAAIPFDDTKMPWPRAAYKKYGQILEKAARKVYVSTGGYHPTKMQVRNQYMVDNADLVIAAWDGSNGGTYNCVYYAIDMGRPIENLLQGYCAYDNFTCLQ